MRLLFVADGRSPIALNWISYFIQQGHEVHLASTFACRPELNLTSLAFIPVALSGFKAASEGDKSAPAKGTRQNQAALAPRPGLQRFTTAGFRTVARQVLGPLTLPGAARRLASRIDQVRPDLVHAMRIPYEGMLAALALENRSTPLVVSVWGNDFTLHAPSTPLMEHFTRRTLQRTNGLHADCFRDVRLARAWGLPSGAQAVVLPGGGGVQAELFFPPAEGEAGPPVVINPRGLRAYVRNDTFFRAIPLVLRQLPGVRFLCTGMAGEPEALRLWQASGGSPEVELLPNLSRLQLAQTFRQAQVAVSPSTHDGTPNTLLEAMACGCFPVVGDLESLREWITPGVNGLVVDPGDPEALADALILALSSPALRKRARTENQRQIAARASHPVVMSSALNFYLQVGN